MNVDVDVYQKNLIKLCNFVECRVTARAEKFEAFEVM